MFQEVIDSHIFIYRIILNSILGFQKRNRYPAAVDIQKLLDNIMFYVQFLRKNLITGKHIHLISLE